jgi:selenide,water dikinase
MDSMDDAGVFRLTPDLALVQTVDFFYPVVNDPRAFGRIVAANSLSDVWAMGGKALTAMNLLAYPAGQIPPEVIEELLIGGSEKLQEAGVVLVGGHTLEQEELTYGMSVTGIVHPDATLTNACARVGDALILTKPLGTGVYANALSRDALDTIHYDAFVGTMERLNLYAADVLRRFDVGAVTDVTGFGLLGHALPIARNAGVTLAVRADAVPLLPDTLQYLTEFYAKEVCKCRRYVAPFLEVAAGVDPAYPTIFSEAQTSGGLLVSIRPDQAEAAVAALRESGDPASAIIGEVLPGPASDAEKPCYLRVTA